MRGPAVCASLISVGVQLVRLQGRQDPRGAAVAAMSACKMTAFPVPRARPRSQTCTPRNQGKRARGVCDRPYTGARGQAAARARATVETWARRCSHADGPSAHVRGACWAAVRQVLSVKQSRIPGAVGLVMCM
ncbi:hypothetical protein BD311DRAFT_449312 [Dichomitus squalens]|uniref:Uncharacterized protein n=1 Tax=Dichomitus squalens TaxID=114155 RepID=A0A4Q9MG81_9APHY|nr:hypothetical protein BD311DRAFT_449312 [Dichomitus squalens]